MVWFEAKKNIRNKHIVNEYLEILFPIVCSFMLSLGILTHQGVSGIKNSMEKNETVIQNSDFLQH